jgi:hypothetical protein
LEIAQTTLSENKASTPNRNAGLAPLREAGRATEDLAFELGSWLAGVESLIRAGGLPEQTATRRTEYSIVRAALVKCSWLNDELAYRLRSSGQPFVSGTAAFDIEQSLAITRLVRELITIADGFAQSPPAEPGGWISFAHVFGFRLGGHGAVAALRRIAGRNRVEYLPERLQELLRGSRIPFPEQAELLQVLPRFGRILRTLEIVGQMLRDDEPLKPSLLIFTRVQELCRELIRFINDLLSREPARTGELFSVMDGAAYTASIEMKKVFRQELTGVSAIRPAPSLYARIETAYSLLHDSYEQILAEFARVIDPSVTTAELLPAFNLKFEQSVILRRQLWQVLQAVKSAEKGPQAAAMADLRRQLDIFLAEPITFLFFKDRETLERFCEEVVRATEKQEAVPILHRFGAYLETLFGQVNMRAALANHPFVEPRKR